MKVYVTLCDIETEMNVGTPDYYVSEENCVLAGLHNTLDNAITSLKARTKNLKIDEESTGYSHDPGVLYRLEGEYQGSVYKYRIEHQQVL